MIYSLPDANPDEAAAIVTAIYLYLEQESPEPEDGDNRWAVAGRLEAMRLPVNGGSLRNGWRS
jgi:hypothetical protein